MGIYCCCNPCRPCNPNGSGSAPENAVVSGAGGSCTAYNTTHTYSSFSDTSDFCQWIWKNAGIGTPNVTLYYIKKDVTLGFCSINALAGQWVIALDQVSLDVWGEVTTGFACNSDTGKVSGTHTFSGGPCSGAQCSGTPAITVAA